MKRKLFALSLVTGVLLCTAGHALAGGTVVNGPANATDADCAPGASPGFEGFGDETLIVLGCVEPLGSAPVVIAAGNSDAYACFYIAPPGAQDGGPCTQVRSIGGRFGELTHALRESSPVTGGRAITALRIGAYDAGIYVSGHAPVGIRHASIRTGTVRSAAAVLKVPRDLGARIGATHPFSVFVGRLPEDADTCNGVQFQTGLTGEFLDRTYKTPRDQASPAERVGVPGGKLCATEGAWEVLRAVKATAVTAREAARLKPSRA